MIDPSRSIRKDFPSLKYIAYGSFSITIIFKVDGKTFFIDALFTHSLDSTISLMELKFKPIRLPLNSVILFSISDIFDFSEPSIITFLI